MSYYGCRPIIRTALIFAAMSAPLLHTTSLAQGRSSNAVRTQSADGFSLTFVDADVKRVIDAVLGAMLHVDYSVDPAVQGNITLSTARPVSSAELIPLLESSLGSVNAVMIVQGEHYRIMPRDAARGSALVAGGPTTNNGIVPGFATEVIALHSGSASQIARMLRQFVGEDVVASVEPSLNQIVITGTAEERNAARQLITRFDVDALANMTFELVRLENVDADTLASELGRIFQPPYDIIGSRVRVIPLPRLRSVLLVAADRSDIAHIQPWIARLDSGAAGKRRLYSYAVQNGRARDMAMILQRVLGMDSSNSDNAASPDVIAPVPRSDTPPPHETGVIDAPQATSSNRRSQITQANQGPRVIASDETNSLLIYADGEEYEFIRDALTRLDNPVPQVLIEAILAEVTLTDELQYGVNFRALSGDFSGTYSSTTSPTPASILPGFAVSWVGQSASAILNSLQSRTNVRVVSAPKLVVLNNQTATLQVGDQVPIVTQQLQSTAAAGAPIVNTVELRDTGVILRVTPRVNESGTVTLDISQEVSDVARTTTSGINSPTIRQRRISSVVATRSGEMVALGGLIRDRTESGRTGIPLLSQIPVIGGLFGNHTRTGSRTELIVLLTPTVIRAPQDAQVIVNQLIEALDIAGPMVENARERQVGGNVPPQ